jgi:broad specificity phosphatase PhoE
VSDLRLVLVRHGVTDWNREGRFQGHLDPPLSDRGRHQAHLAGLRMARDPELRPQRVISSSLGRALQTAEVIARALGVPVHADPRLMEIGQGEWEGRTHDEISSTDGERYAAWRDAPGVRQPPGGEPIADAAVRVRSTLDELVAGGPGTVCVVSHGGTMRLLARIIFELGEDASWALDVDNASIGVASLHDGRWRLERWNDTTHLLGREPTHVDEVEGRPLAL